MHVLHVNFSDVRGSTGRMVKTLLEATERLGCTVNLACQQNAPADPRIVTIQLPQTQWQKTLFKKQTKQGVFDLYSAAMLSLLQHPVYEQADIVHLHSVGGNYFSYLLLPFLAAKPTVWTFHDPAAFTAGCRYTGSCDEWRNNWCRKCPAEEAKTGEPLRRDLVHIIKAAVYKITKFTAVCPSARLLGQVQGSILKGHDSRLIYNGVDTDIFRPGDHVQARARLGLPADKMILLHIAQDDFHDGPESRNCLQATLGKLVLQWPQLLVIDLGGIDADLSVPMIRPPLPANPTALADYYRATDLFVSVSPVDGFNLTVAEAMACGKPVAAFPGGATPEIVLHRQTGYLAADRDDEDLAQGISCFLADPKAGRDAGTAGRARMVENFTAGKMAASYMSLYEEMLETAGGQQVMVWVKEKLPQLAQQAQCSGWKDVWAKLSDLYNRFDRDETAERAVFVDQCLALCLKYIDPAGDVVWDIVQLWFQYRRMPAYCGSLPPLERQALMDFGRTLREKIREYFNHNSLRRLSGLEQPQQMQLINVWKNLFFNYSSILNLHDDAAKSGVAEVGIVDRKDPLYYEKMLVASMDQPFAADAYPITAEDLREASIPHFCRIILAYWLANTPYFNLEEKHRQKLLACLPVLCEMHFSPLYFTHFVTEILNDLWRVSYIGDNNLAALSSFGDFITRHMERFFPRYTAAGLAGKSRRNNGKIRIGYISRLFYQQAVSFYMVNRIIHHDRDRFEVYVFALGDRQDSMTDQFVKHSDHIKRIANMHDLGNIAQVIIDSQLDILVFTDIGMDPMTYMLAGLRLAPVQCAMVGHGTTTGMPKIQYYISGDFEPADADSHYCETLIRLPNLGAAQYPPAFSGDIGPCRKEWKLPDDVVVFVSCANGLKHVPARDEVLLQILKRAPNSCIILKPYFSAQEGDVFTRRVIGRAKEAGVDSRLFIIPPLGKVEAVLAIADVQLDTYPYGGWTTNMEALYMGLPIVTQEGPMARNRWGSHMLRALGVSEGIAHNEQEYVEWAVRFADDADLRHRVKRQIQQKAGEALFNGAEAQAAYEEALIRIYEKELLTRG